MLPGSAAAVWLMAGHDLRQPLQSLALTSRILTLDCTQAERRTAIRNLELVLASFDDMVIAVTELAGLASGTRTPDITSVSLGDLVDAVVADCQAAAAVAGIAIEQLPLPTAEIETDPKLLAKIVKTLLLYAIKHGTGDRIVVKARRRRATTILDVVYAGQPPGNALKKQAFIELNPLDTDPPRLVQGLGLAFAALVADCLGVVLQTARAPGGLQRLSLEL